MSLVEFPQDLAARLYDACMPIYVICSVLDYLRCNLQWLWCTGCPRPPMPA